MRLAHAQYTDIPNFTGATAGKLYRQALNAKLGGTDTNGRIVSIPFANLPNPPVNHQLFFVTDGAPGVPCRGGGGGALAMGVNGEWSCSAVSNELQNVLAYGARGDDINPDDAAIQAAVDSLPNNSTAAANAVYLPGTQGGSYLLGRPVYLHNAELNFYGDGPSATFLKTNYFGPSGPSSFE